MMYLDKFMRLLGLPTAQQKYIERQKTQGSFCFIHINKCGGTSVERALGLPLIHDTARQRIEKIGRARWDELVTFALIRHPYDKVISHYKYRVKTDQTGMGDGHIGLDDWVAESYGARNPRYLDNALMFQPCLDWLTDAEGAMAVQHILKLETIGAEWPSFCVEKLGVAVELGHHNTTKPDAPTERRLSDASIDILRAHFAPDFERFDYDPDLVR